MHSLALDTKEFRRTCGRFTAGVVIATAMDADGLPHGITLSSFTPVSMEPPLVLVCVDNRASFLSYLSIGCYFGVNMLKEDHQELSRRFSRNEAERFSGVTWHPGRSGVPVLAEVLATIESRLTQTVQAGDHMVLIGQAVHVTYGDGNPLAYFSGCYRKLQWEHSLARSQDGFVSSIDWSVIIE